MNCGQSPPLTTELAALKRLKNRCHNVFSVDIDLIVFKPSGIEDGLNILDELNFRQIGLPTMELAALERLKNPIGL